MIAEALSALPLATALVSFREKRDRRLDAQATRNSRALGVPDRELSHSYGSYATFDAYATGSQMFVSAIQFTASEIQPGIGMSGSAVRVPLRWAVLWGDPES